MISVEVFFPKTYSKFITLRHNIRNICVVKIMRIFKEIIWLRNYSLCWELNPKLTKVKKVNKFPVFCLNIRSQRSYLFCCLKILHTAKSPKNNQFTKKNCDSLMSFRLILSITYLIRLWTQSSTVQKQVLYKFFATHSLESTVIKRGKSKIHHKFWNLKIWTQFFTIFLNLLCLVAIQVNLASQWKFDDHSIQGRI